MIITIKFEMNSKEHGKLQLIWETISNILRFAGINNYSMKDEE